MMEHFTAKMVMKTVLLCAIIEAAAGSLASGTLFYAVQGSRCITSSPMATIQSVPNYRVCLSNCLRQPTCASMQYYPSNGNCYLFSSMTKDFFYANSVISTAGSCVVYNRRCVNPTYYFNFTGFYTPAQVSGTWNATRGICQRLRYDLAVLTSSSALAYLNTLTGSTYYSIGNTRINGSYQWLDGTVGPASVTNNYNSNCGSCGSGTDCLVYKSGALGYSDCGCSCAALCGCEEWGLV